MYRIDVPTAADSPPTIPPAAPERHFTAGDPLLSILPTEVPAWWLQMVQEEIRNAVLAAGIAPDKSNNGQLAAAIGISYAPVPLSITASHNVVSANRARVLVVSGTAAITLQMLAGASLPPGWHVWVRHAGAQVLTVVPAGAEGIDGGASLRLRPRSTTLITWDGATWRAVPMGGGDLTRGMGYWMGQN